MTLLHICRVCECSTPLQLWPQPSNMRLPGQKLHSCDHVSNLYDQIFYLWELPQCNQNNFLCNERVQLHSSVCKVIINWMCGSKYTIGIFKLPKGASWAAMSSAQSKANWFVLSCHCVMSLLLHGRAVRWMAMNHKTADSLSCHPEGTK